MTRDMRDAHETARERDAIPWRGSTFAEAAADIARGFAQARDAAWMLGALDGTGGPRDRTHDDQETDMADAVNHPAHYTGHPSGVECIDVTEHFNFCRGNAIKYVWRAGAKGDELEDLRKARWYLDREIERMEGDVPTERTDWLDEPIPVPRPEPVDVPVGEHHPLANLCRRHYCEHSHDPSRVGIVFDLDTAIARAERAETRLVAVTNERDKWNGLAHEADRNAKRHYERAEKAEADLARVTGERDGERAALEHACARVISLTEERDEARTALAEAPYQSDLDEAQAKADRVTARLNAIRAGLSRCTSFSAVAAAALTEDDERARGW